MPDFLFDLNRISSAREKFIVQRPKSTQTIFLHMWRAEGEEGVRKIREEEKHWSNVGT